MRPRASAPAAAIAKSAPSAHIAATSFFPSKPLGCYGDGGAVFTADAEAAALLRSLRQHGEGRDRYDTVRIGINSRLDSLQAAVLLAKLSIFAEEIELRQQVAERYSAALGDVVEVPVIDRKARSVWAQYTIKVDNRDRVAAGLKAVGVPTAIYYPRSLNHQPAYRGYPDGGGRRARGGSARPARAEPALPPLSRRGDPGLHHRPAPRRHRRGLGFNILILPSREGWACVPAPM